MKQTMQRTLAFLLAFVMLVGMMPIGAMAAETEAEPHTHSTYPAIELDVETTVNITTEDETAYFSFTPDETADYTFSSSSDYDTYGYLYDSQMREIDCDDDGGSGYNFKLTYTLTADTTYILGARFLDEYDTGSFTVKLVKECNHAYETSVTDPTCNTRGYTTYTCSLCGYSYKGNYEDVLGHNFKDLICTVCGYEPPEIQLHAETDVYIANFGEIVYFCFTPEITAEYTFYSSGSSNTCGYIYDSSMNQLAYNNDHNESYNFSIPYSMEAGATYILAARLYNSGSRGSFTVRITTECSHEYTTVVTDATCTDEGYTTHTCKICGYSYTDNYEDAYGHDFTNGLCGNCGYKLPVIKLDTDMIAKPYDCPGSIALFSFTPTVSGYYTFHSYGDKSPFGFFYEEDMTMLDSTDDEEYEEDYDAFDFHITCYLEANRPYILGARNFPFTYSSFTVRITLDCDHEYTAVVTEATCTEGGCTTYTCDLCGFSYTDDYTDALDHNFEDGICTFCGFEADVIELNTNVTVNIRTEGEIAYFIFTPEVSGTHTFYSIGSSDTKGYLYDYSMNQLDSDDDYGSGYNFSITCYMEAGTTYILGAKYCSSTSVGTFTVRITRACDHEFSTVVTEPTCSQNGYSTYTCDLCGFSYVDDYRNAYGHSFEGTTCTRCYAEIPVIELNAKTSVDIDIRGAVAYYRFIPTETAEYFFYSIGDEDTVGYIYDADMNELCYGDENDYDSNFEIIDTLTAGTTYILGARFYASNETGVFDIVIEKCCNHSYTDVVTAPTCSSRGYSTYTCGLCGKSYVSNYIDALGHKYENGVCVRCEQAITSIEVNTETSAVITTGGEIAYFIFTPAKTSEYIFYSTGWYDTYGYIYDESMNRLAFNDDNDNDDYGNFEIRYTLEADVTYILGARFYSSSRIGEFPVWIIKGCEHSYSAVVTEPTCAEDGYTTYTCELCGQSYKDDYTESVSHSYEDGICTSCGKEAPPYPVIQLDTKTMAVIETGGEYAYFLFTPTETRNYVFYSEANADTCGTIFNDRLEELYYNDDGGIDTNFRIECTLRAGVTYILGACYYSETRTGEFPVYVAAGCNHEYNIVVIEPTCDTMGYTEYTCSLCGDEYMTYFVDVLGHDMDGNTCTRCGLQILDIQLNERTTANIARGEAIAYFYFTPAETAEYTFYSLSDRDTCGYIYNEWMDELAYNDQYNQYDNNFAISYTLEAGTTYILGARFWDSDETGSFTVVVSDQPPCSHEYSSKQIEPTCTTCGYSIRTCTLCGYSYESINEPALDHQIEDAACFRCGMEVPVIELDTLMDVVLAADGVSGYFAFTPTETGTYTFQSLCTDNTTGWIYDSDMCELDRGYGVDGEGFCIETNMTAGETYILRARYFAYRTGQFSVKIVKNCVHEFTEVVTDPTCTTYGYTTFTCNLCGYSYRDYFYSALGHQMDGTVCTLCGVDTAAMPTIQLGVITTATITTEGERAYFRFTPEETGLYTFRSIGECNTDGYIYDENMTELWQQVTNTYTENHVMHKKLYAGRTYILGAEFAWDEEIGSFDICVEPLETITLQADTTVDIEINEESEFEYFSFTPAVSGRYIFSTDTNSVCDIYLDHSGTDGYGYKWYYVEYSNQFIVLDLPANETIVFNARLYELTEESRCSISLEYVPEPDPIPLTLGTETEVNLDQRGHYARFSFTPDESGRYRFYSTGDYETFGCLYTSDMIILAGSYILDDVGNFCIDYELEAGKTYILSAEFNYATEIGTFNVCVEKCVEPEKIPLELNSTATATIDYPGGYCYFTFTPETSGEYTFYSTNSNGYDTFAYLYDSDMYLLVMDDDSGDHWNFALTWDLNAGQTYILRAEFNSRDMIGSYEVGIVKGTELPGEPSEPDHEEPSEPEDGLEIVIQPADYVGIVGDMATFTVAAEGEGLTYQWFFSKDGGATWEKSSATSNTLTVEFKAYRLGYLYHCEVTDSEGNTVVSDAAVLTALEQDLVIVTQPVSYVGAVNDDVTFTVEATGNGLVYEWFFSDDGGETWAKSYSPGYATNTLAPILRAHRDGNMYKCVVTDVLGNSVESDVVSMSVETDEIIIVAQPVSVENAVLSQLYGYSVVAEGVNLTYRWQVSTDGGETWEDSWNQGYNTPNLSVRMNANRDGNLYRCAITSGQKLTVYTDVVILDMQDPSVELIGQSGNVLVTANKTATFTVEAEGMDLTYLWYRSNDKGATWNQTYLSGYNTNTLSFVGNVGRAAMYMCKITDGSGTVVWSSPVKLQILSAELKILSQPVSTTCAAGETVTFHVDAQGDTLKYQWYGSTDGVNWEKSYLSGYNTDTFSFAVNATRAAKVYKCVITDVAGNTVETDIVSVTIN